MGTGSFSGVKSGWVVLLTTHPLLVPQSWKSRAIPLPTLWATPGLEPLYNIDVKFRGIKFNSLYGEPNYRKIIYFHIESVETYINKLNL